MSCNGCKLKVENALGSISQIKKINVDVAKNSVYVEMISEVTLKSLQDALIANGLHYTFEGAQIKNHSSHKMPKEDVKGALYYCPMLCEGSKEYKTRGACPVCGMDLLPKNIRGHSSYDLVYEELLFKLKISVLFAVFTVMISMANTMPNSFLHQILQEQIWNWIQLTLTLPIVFYSCWMFFERAWVSVKTLNFNMFTLIGMGTGVAFIFSVVCLINPNFLPEEFKASSNSAYLYFESVSVILTFVLLGQFLEAKAHRVTGLAIRELFELTPEDAILVNGDVDSHISIDDVELGNVLKVLPGAKIPVDGKIIEGSSYIDESMITGESVSCFKKLGDLVCAGTINKSNLFLMRAEKLGKDTLLSHIISSVQRAMDSKIPMQRLVDSISKYFVPCVIVISVITFLCWLGFYDSYKYAIANAIGVLIISCPCVLGLATPMSVMVGMGVAAKSGVLVKDSATLELFDKVDVLIVDKTGTITKGDSSVEYIYTDSGDTEKIFRIIASLTKNSNHPISKSIVKHLDMEKYGVSTVENFEEIPGIGIRATIERQKVFLGNDKLIKGMIIPEVFLDKVEREQVLGKTISYLAVEGKIEAFVCVSDPIKETSFQAIESFNSTGIDLIMMTGDNINVAKYISNELGIKKFKAGCLPQDKLNEVEKMQSKGRVVAVVGDGINDAPALAKAHVGIAMADGTSIAIESSDVTIINGDLRSIFRFKKISRNVIKNIKENLLFAFGYNALAIPIAAGILYPSLGIVISPVIASMAMSLSSVSVIINSLRLRKMSF
ncbi:hypothetical protein JBKA6_1384 [Ichthyobacterium seriolicida]|uniref:HMA domain-containing protein n=2 Tax=Ichthyobacterium seriolicida TaxID=242600 RepID=A0A1J1E348_9FLAO|nr:hypothetical protein JBKA6_1384 [Ichthyobacterium seriolicida]